MTGAVGTAQLDKPGFMELVLHPDMTSEGAGSDMELIAIRGDDLCLYLVGMISPDGDVTERIIVDATRDGRCTHMDIFDPDHLADALAVVDRRYRLACGIGDDHWITAHWRVIYSAEFAEIQPVLHPEFESVERRPLAWPSGNTADWREWMTPNSAPLEVTIPAMYRLCEHGVVSLRSERLEAGDLGVSEVVLVNAVEAGSVRRVISCAPEDLDQALAEFDEFVAGRSGQTLTNSAWLLVQQAAVMWRQRDRSGFAGLDAMFDPLVFGPASSNELDLIAVRGDDLCLFRTRATTPLGDVHERLAAAEVHDGRVVRMDVFPHDQLVDSQLELDRRWFESIGYAGRWWQPIRFVLYDPHPDAMFEHLAPDFEYIDHRPLVFPSGDAEHLRSTIPPCSTTWCSRFRASIGSRTTVRSSSASRRPWVRSARPTCARQPVRRPARAAHGSLRHHPARPRARPVRRAHPWLSAVGRTRW
jgi:hypothetical protein